MKNTLNRALYHLLAPVKHYPISFVFLSIAFMLPEFVSGINLQWLKDNFLFLNFHLLICVALTYFLVSLAYFVSKLNTKLGLLVIIIFHIIIYALVFSDIFLYKVFGTHINVYMLQLVDETNSQESSEFLRTYLPTRVFGKVLLSLCLYLGTEFLLAQYLNRKFNIANKWQSALDTLKPIGSTLLCIYILGSFGTLFFFRSCFTLDWAANLEEEKAWEYKFIQSFVFREFQAGVQFLDERNAFNRSEQAHQNITATIKEPSVQNIIVIIGESFNRHHSNLYGYGLETNPRLSQLKHLYVFDDVISPINSTTPAFKNFFSMASTDDSLAWCDVPLFPAFFKKVGFNVTFYSNQFVKLIKMSPYDASIGFVNNPHIEPFIFSHRNSIKHKYDEGIIKEYKDNRKEVERDSLNFIFFHLMGQHVNSQQRFPKERETFHIEDYHRQELTEQQIQEVANYDNATYYNDSVVAEIINLYEDKDALILYFADHGDEANDFRPHIGRAMNLNEIGSPGLHCQLDIPFIIHLTDSCSSKHPELEQRIAQSIHRPFMIDDLPHLLLDIAGIDAPGYQPARSLINEKFNVKRKRIIHVYNSTVSLDYDSICNAYGKWEIGYKTNNND